MPIVIRVLASQGLLSLSWVRVLVWKIVMSIEIAKKLQVKQKGLDFTVKQGSTVAVEILVSMEVFIEFELKLSVELTTVDLQVSATVVFQQVFMLEVLRKVTKE